MSAVSPAGSSGCLSYIKTKAHSTYTVIKETTSNTLQKISYIFRWAMAKICPCFVSKPSDRMSRARVRELDGSPAQRARSLSTDSNTSEEDFDPENMSASELDSMAGAIEENPGLAASIVGVISDAFTRMAGSFVLVDDVNPLEDED